LVLPIAKSLFDSFCFEFENSSLLTIDVLSKKKGRAQQQKLIVYVKPSSAACCKKEGQDLYEVSIINKSLCVNEKIIVQGHTYINWLTGGLNLVLLPRVHLLSRASGDLGCTGCNPHWRESIAKDFIIFFG